MSDTQKASENDALELELELAYIAARAELLREILRACERGGELEHRTDLHTVFAPGLALIADDIRRAAMVAYEVAPNLGRRIADLERQAQEQASTGSAPRRRRIQRLTPRQASSPADASGEPQ